MSIFARSVREPSGNSPCSHPLEEIEILVDGAIAVGAVLAGLGERAAILADLVGGQIADVRLARLDELDRPIVKLLEVVGGVEQPVFPIEAQPADVVHDRIDVLLLFLGRIGVVEAQVALAAVIPWRGRSSGRSSWRGRCADSRSARAETACARGRRACRCGSSSMIWWMKFSEAGLSPPDSLPAGGIVGVDIARSILRAQSFACSKRISPDHKRQAGGAVPIRPM